MNRNFKTKIMEHLEKQKIAEEILKTLVFIKGQNPELDIYKLQEYAELILEKSEFQDRNLLIASLLFKGFEFKDVNYVYLHSVFGTNIMQIFSEAKIYSERNRNIELCKAARLLLLATAKQDFAVNENNIYFYKELLEKSKGINRRLEYELENLIYNESKKVFGNNNFRASRVLNKKCA